MNYTNQPTLERANPNARPINAYTAPANYWTNTVRPNGSSANSGYSNSGPNYSFDKVTKAERDAMLAAYAERTNPANRNQSNARGISFGQQLTQEQLVFQQRELATKQLHQLTLEHAKEREFSGGQPGLYRNMGNWLVNAKADRARSREADYTLAV